MRRFVQRVIGFRSLSRFSFLALGIACLLPATSAVYAQKNAEKSAIKKTISEKPSPGQSTYNDAANIQNNGEYALAATEWRKFLKKYPNDKLAPQARHYLGVCLLQQGNYDDAGKVFEQVVRDHKDFEFVDESHLNLGWCRYSAAVGGGPDKFPLAEKTLREFLGQHKDSELRDQALFYLGECLYLQGNREEAVATYQQLVDKHADSKLRADGLYALGVAQQEQQQYKPAINTYDQFVDGFPDHELATEVRMRKGESLIKIEDYADAEKVFANVSKDREFVDYNHSLFRHAYCVLKQNRYSDAGQLYSQIPSQLTDKKFAAAANVSAGRAFFKAGDSAQAKASLQKATSDVTAGSEAAHWLCRIAIKDKEIDNARRIAESAISRAKPKDTFLPSLKLDLADALYETQNGKTQALASYLDIANRFASTDTAKQSLYNAAYAAMELEKYPDAIRYAKEFETKFSNHRLTPDVRYVAAESHLLDGKHGAAEQAYAALVRDFPKHKQNGLWRLRYAAALQVQDKHDETIRLAESQLSVLKDPKQIAEAHYLIGYSQSKLGKNADAQTAYEASLRASTNWRRADDAVLQLSQVLTALGKKDDAKEVFNRYKTSIEQSDRPDAIRYQLAETNYESSNYQAAFNAYASLLKQWPKSEFAPSALFGKAWSQFKLGSPAESVVTFTQLIDGYSDHELIPRSYRARAMCRQLSGDAKGGIGDVASYLATSPPTEDRAEAYYVRGLCETALKQPAAARESFEMVLAKYPNYNRRDRVLYELAWMHKSAKESDQAFAKFKEIVNNHPASRLSSEAYYHMGEYSYNKKEFPAAIESYSASIASRPTDEIGERAFYKRGWSEYQQKSFASALGSFRSQVQRYENGKLQADGQFMVGECLFALQKYEETIAAVRNIDFARLSEQSRVLAKLHAGQSAVQLKQWQTAVDLLEPVVAENQTSSLAGKAAFELGRAYQGLDRTDKAESFYKQAAEKSRNSTGARSQFMLGELYFARKDFEPALQEFQRVMYGFGGDKAPASVKPWQARSGIEAGRVAAVLAGQSKDKAQRADYVTRARKYFEYVTEQHAGTAEATVAGEQLKKLGS